MRGPWGQEQCGAVGLRVVEEGWAAGAGALATQCMACSSSTCLDWLYVSGHCLPSHPRMNAVSASAGSRLAVCTLVGCCMRRPGRATSSSTMEAATSSQLCELGQAGQAGRMEGSSEQSLLLAHDGLRRSIAPHLPTAPLAVNLPLMAAPQMPACCLQRRVWPRFLADNQHQSVPLYGGCC